MRLIWIQNSTTSLLRLTFFCEASTGSNAHEDDYESVNAEEDAVFP